MKMLMKNANIIIPYEIKRNSSLVIEDGRIANIFDGKSLNENIYDLVIDVKGHFLSPGFIDIHNHGGLGHDFMEGTYKALDSIADFHLKNGVTSLLATIMTEDINTIRKAINGAKNYIENAGNSSKLKSQVLGIYLEGPYFALEKKGGQPEKHIKKPDLEEIKELIKYADNHIKIVSLAPELKGADDIIRYLRKEGILVSAGHTNATLEEAKNAIELGVTQATHLYNGMRAFNHREPGVIGAVLTDDRVICEIICDGIHNHFLSLDLAVKLKGMDKVILISDSMMAAGMKDGKYLLGGQDVFMKDGEARLVDGALAGSTHSLNKAVYNMIKNGIVPLEDAVKMASLNPAKAIGLDDVKGSIEIGKDADLIIFDENVNIIGVMVKGKYNMDNVL
jgi:N-acetylglucosamine-6-phosphate deacetylase